jgi:hypothetical protein
MPGNVHKQCRLLSPCRLAGVAGVEKTGDLFLDSFLLLPADALALMSADLEFQ